MNNAEWNELKKNYYGKNVVAQTDEGTIDFSPGDFAKLETHGNNISYDEYLDIMRVTGNDVRHYFELCFFNCGAIADCKGQIERVDKTGKNIVFQRIYVSGMEMDGFFFDGKEDHVWMDLKGFEEFSKGDSLSFSAEVYRYLKTGNGKRIDYALRNPENIKKIDEYELPGDDALLMQSIDSIICETCLYADHCYGEPCIANPKWREEMRDNLKLWLT